MKNRMSLRSMGNPVPLIAATIMGTTGLIAMRDCRQSEEQQRVRQDVSALEVKNAALDRAARNRVYGLIRENSGADAIILSCKGAYDLCMDGGELPVGCQLDQEDAKCGPVLNSDLNTVNDLRCCLAIQHVENACKAAYNRCLRAESVVKL